METKENNTESKEYHCGLPYICRAINRISEIMLEDTNAYRKGAINGFTTGISLSALIIAIVALFVK